jgi:hypothetical protein
MESNAFHGKKDDLYRTRYAPEPTVPGPPATPGPSESLACHHHWHNDDPRRIMMMMMTRMRPGAAGPGDSPQASPWHRDRDARLSGCRQTECPGPGSTVAAALPGVAPWHARRGAAAAVTVTSR